MCVYECVCVPFAYLKNRMSKLHDYFLLMLRVAVARSSSDDNAIRYVLPVLWLFPYDRPIIQTYSLRRRELFTVTR